MASLSDMTSSGPVVMVGPSTLADMAEALSGSWDPNDVDDLELRNRLVAAARLRLYAERDRSGWMLLTTRSARRALLADSEDNWAVGFIAVVEDFDDLPAPDELSALQGVFGSEGIEPGPATSLSYAYLIPKIGLIVTNNARDFRHSRSSDLPAHLQLIEPGEAVELLSIAPNEVPPVAPPGLESATGADAWWIPRS